MLRCTLGDSLRLADFIQRAQGRGTQVLDGGKHERIGGFHIYGTTNIPRASTTHAWFSTLAIGSIHSGTAQYCLTMVPLLARSTNLACSPSSELSYKYRRSTSRATREQLAIERK